MEKSNKAEKVNTKETKIKTFPIPHTFESIHTDISNSASKSNLISKEKILEKAFESHSKGKLKEAAKYYQYFLNQGFSDPNVYSNLGVIYIQQGIIDKAIMIFKESISKYPSNADAYSNLGNLQKNLGNTQEAEISIRKAIELNNNHPEALLNLGVILKAHGQTKEAELVTRKAIPLKKNFAEAYLNLGSILKDLGELEEAELVTRKAIKIKRDYSEAYLNLGCILIDLGRQDESSQCFLNASKYAPNDIYYYLSSRLILSPIMNNNSEIEIQRKRYKEELKNIEDNKDFTIGNLNGFTPYMFYLAYQNKSDDRLILEQQFATIAKVKGMVCKDFSREIYLGQNHYKDKIRVGICSQFLNPTHTIGKLYINVLSDLLKTDLDITIYLPPGTKNDSGLEKIRNLFGKVVDLPNSPQLGAKKIISEKLDVLFYPDIGMSSYTYILALSRLALVQVNSLGHTNTSGISHMDYYITTDMEPKKSDSNYTERLVRFNRLPFNYSIPNINTNNLSNSKGIDIEKSFNIGLTQSLFKLHPSYDEVLVSILNKIENAKLILIKDKNDSNTNTLKNRWLKKNKLLLEKSIFLERMSNDDFMNITKSCHIMLDPFYFGSGNTFYESMAFGTPFITYPDLQKSIIPVTGYKQMNVINPPIANTAEEYINICISYSRNKTLLEETSLELTEKAKKNLFNDNKIYKEYYNFFITAVEKAKKGN